jgi:DNA-binding protein H-NS
MPKLSSLSMIEARIKALQRQARQVERSATQGLRAAAKVISKYDLSVSDLRRALAMSRGRAPSKLTGRRVAVKYRDSAGNTWTGRGRAPLWLVAAEKAGKKRGSFLVSQPLAKTPPRAQSKAARARRTRKTD